MIKDSLKKQVATLFINITFLFALVRFIYVFSKNFANGHIQ